MPVVLALDAGTTGVRTLAVDADGRPVPWPTASSHSTSRSPGWVEHDADDILEAALATLAEVATRGRGERRHRRRDRDHEPARDRGRVGPQHRPAPPPRHRLAGPAHRAGVRRASAPSGSRAPGPIAHRPRARPVLLGDEARVAAHEGDVAVDDDARGRHRRHVAPVEPHGRSSGGVHATEPSNASRTLLYDITHQRVVAPSSPTSSACRSRASPRYGPSFGPLRRHRARRTRPDSTVPISGIAGDQQASLFGQACFEPGHDQEHLRHRFVRAHERRRHAPRARRRPAHHGGLAARRRRSPTRSRARSSSPARRSSGCATGSGILEVVGGRRPARGSRCPTPAA